MTNDEPYDQLILLSQIDLASIPLPDDKLEECSFFFKALSTEPDRKRFRWFVSAFLNAAYSFFESEALTAHFRFFNPDDGALYPDQSGVTTLRKHVKVKQIKTNPEYVSTQGKSVIAKKLYQIRNKNVHCGSLIITSVGESLPDDFRIKTSSNESVPAVVFCSETLQLINDIYSEING